MKNRTETLATQLLYGDRDFDGDTGVSPPIEQSLNYRITEEVGFEDMSVPLGHRLYARRGNPNNARLISLLAHAERAESGMIFASGMAAISTSMLALLRAGDHVVTQRSHYIGTSEMANKVLPSFGIETTCVDQTSVTAFEQAIRPNTKLIVMETPVNPLMHITDLAAVCDLAKQHGIATFCDNTFASPINQRPAEFGVDLVMHSISKYIGGHHDLLGGALVGSRELVERVWDLSLTLGSVGAPFNSWLALRGLRTLDLRMRRHNANGQAIAEMLQDHPAVQTVYYPGLTSHPQHDLACRQMSGFGGLLTFDLAGGYEAGQRFIQKLQLADNASSLGGVTSVVIQPAALFGGRLPESALKDQGLTTGMIRFASGIEDTDDLLADIAQALE